MATTEVVKDSFVETVKEGCGGYWEEHPVYLVADWKYEIANGDTREGYWEWVAIKVMEEL